MAQIRESDVGEYFILPNDPGVWQCVAYCPEPTAYMENVKTGERVSGGASSLLMKPFVKLVRADA